MAKRYAKRRYRNAKRRNSKKRQRRFKRKKMSLSRLANKVSQINIQKMSEPLYVDELFGTSWKDDFSADTTFDLKSGFSSASNGICALGPKVETQVLVDGTSGIQMDLEPGKRKDMSIMVTGFSLEGRLATDSEYACVQVFFGTTNDVEGNLDASYFQAPTQLDSLKDRQEDAHRVRKVYWTKKYTLQKKYNQHHKMVNVNKFHRFPKPIKIKFDGFGATDWVGRRFFLAMTCYNPQEGSSDFVNWVGQIRYYYRDL